jgi:hypothetical protein
VRVFGHCLLGVCVAVGWVAAQAPAQSPGPKLDPVKAEAVLAEARKALGGEKLTAVKTLVLSGQTRKLQGNNLVPVEFEIDIELPDKYVRKDEIPAQENGPTSSGFSGSDLIQLPPPAAPVPPPARPGGPPPPTPEQLLAQQATQRKTRVAAIKQDFVRLTLGMFAAAMPAAPLTFGYVGQAEAPQGRAEVIDVKGEGTFALRFFLSTDTHLPIMVSWQQPPTSVAVRVPGFPAPANLAPGTVVIDAPPPPPDSATQAEKDKYAKDVADLRRQAQAKPIESRLYYADYRDVEGRQWPFRLRRAIGSETTEETAVDRYRINVKIDPKKFEAVK